MEGRAWWTMVHRIIKNQTRLSEWARIHSSFQTSPKMCGINYPVILQDSITVKYCLKKKNVYSGFPGGSVVKNLPGNAGNAD